GETYNALNVASPELMVLFPAYDTDMLAKLTDMWDCGPYSESRRKEEHTFSAERTCMTMLAATTETHLLCTFPEQAFSSGFMSRTVMVHSSPLQRASLFGEQRPTKTLLELEARMKVDLKIISQLAGEFVFTEEAARKLDAFYTYPGNLG